MSHHSKIILSLIFVLSVASNQGNAYVEMDHVPPIVQLTGDNGGKLDGASWNSSELKGAVYILMYVDPDKVKVNEHVEEALAKEQYPPDQFRSVAITNLAATWKPKFLIEKSLNEKQKKYPRTTYLIDKRKVCIEQWQLLDHSYDVLLFDRSGYFLFNKSGALSSEDIKNLTTMIWTQITK